MGSDADEAATDRLYRDLIPLTRDQVSLHTALIPGALERLSRDPKNAGSRSARPLATGV